MGGHKHHFRVVRGQAVATKLFASDRGSETNRKGDRMTVADASKIRILCVDDHPLVRDGISFAIQFQADMELVGEATNGEEAVAEFRRLRPDITLMDLQMPGLNGIEALETIRREFPKARVIVLTTYSGDVQAWRAFRAGAVGYLLKSMLRTELVTSIRDVHMGRKRIPPEIAASLAHHFVQDDLSAREIEVLRFVAAGHSNKIVADDLSISEDTLKGHMKNIIAKLGASDRTHAVLIAIKRGFLES
jgi:DNA-binding NarL/FixJ family response regulator